MLLQEYSKPLQRFRFPANDHGTTYQNVIGQFLLIIAAIANRLQYILKGWLRVPEFWFQSNFDLGKEFFDLNSDYYLMQFLKLRFVTVIKKKYVPTDDSLANLRLTNINTCKTTFITEHHKCPILN